MKFRPPLAHPSTVDAEVWLWRNGNVGLSGVSYLAVTQVPR
jgi:hypothetical protein